MRSLHRDDRIVERGRPLAPLTTWGIGGVASELITPDHEDDLAALAEELSSNGRSFAILGGGSNMLIADGTIDTTIISTAALDTIEVVRDRDSIVFSCGAGSLVRDLMRATIEHGASGLEFMAGIPGTIGGALAGNAGACGGSISDRLAVADIYRPGKGRDRYQMSPSDWGYRSSPFADGAAVILRATFALDAEDPSEVSRKIRDVMSKRSGQPNGVKTAGCVFKNPDGASAGRLLDEAGCKGMSVGGVRVSPKHANFFENIGGASASDVVELARLCRDAVREKFGVVLEPEVRTIGLEWKKVP